MVAILDPDKLARAIRRLGDRAMRARARAALTCPCCGAHMQVKVTANVLPANDGRRA